MVSVTIAAKLVKSAFEIGLEFLGMLDVTRFMSRSLGLSSLEFSVILTIAFVFLGVFLFKYDWGRFLRRTSRPESDTRFELPVGAP